MPLVNLENINTSRVFVRVDFDVPIIENIVQNIYRIKRSIPTLKKLLEQNNTLVLFTKVGRPVGMDEHLSTKHFLKILKEDLEMDINFENDIDRLSRSFIHKITLFENTRFYEWEDKDNEEFDRRIANFFDYYVDEAFAVSHRQEASNFGIPSKIKNIAMGLNYLNEIKHLEKIKNGDFEKPAIFILGGAKAETKIPMIEKIQSNFNYIVVGGKLVLEEEMKTLKQKVSNLVMLPLEENKFDINSKAIETTKSAIQLAKTIVWNGPLGMFEKEEYAKSTRELLKIFAEKKDALTIAGGGDTISAIEKYGNFDDFSFISTGGGAMFSYLAGEKTNIQKIIANKKTS